MLIGNLPAEMTVPKRFVRLGTIGMVMPILSWLAGASPAQTKPIPPYPKEIRGYKIERTVVELKKTGKESPGRNTNVDSTSESDVDALIQFGKPQLARVTPL